MEFTQFNDLVLKVHSNGKISTKEKDYIKDSLPIFIGNNSRCYSYPHPSGIKIIGAPSRTFISSYSLLLAKKAYQTKRIIPNKFYEDIEKGLTIGIFRSGFYGNQVKGFYCCKRCSLAVFPLLELDYFHYIESNKFIDLLRSEIVNRNGRFSKGMNDKIVDFQLSFKN